MKKWYKSIIFRMSAENCTIFSIFYSYFYHPDKNSLEGFTNLYSRSRSPLTIVQVGANDGINNDPVHKFIKRDGWLGVVLEPQKLVFEKYLKPLYARTPGITTVNAAIDATDGQRALYKIAFSDSRWATGLSSFRKESLDNSLKSGFIEKRAKMEGCALPDKNEEYFTTELVNCISPSTLIERYSLDKIDWLQVDTEGYDFEIIKMFNSTVPRPEVIVFENLHLSPSQLEECTGYLKGKGYYCRNFGPDTLAMRVPASGFEYYFPGQ